jgi:succinyl-diaminopimelate desuccinylase
MPEIIPSPDPNYLMDLLKKIISFKTVAPPGSNYQEIVDWLIPIYAKNGHATRRLRCKMR